MSKAQEAEPIRRVTLSTLGVCSIEIEGRMVTSVPSIVFRIASYLYLSSQSLTASRQKLGSVFWPEVEHEQAAANLRQGLARVRRFQEDHDFQLIEASFTLVHVDPSHLSWDLAEVVDALDGNDGAAVAALCKFYGGDLLSDIAESSEEFEDWLSEQRAQLRDAMVEKLVCALDGTIHVSPSLRLACARKLLTIDASNEQAFRLLMTEAAENGDYARVRQIFQRYERNTMEEFGVAGSPHTRALFKQLMDGEQP